MLSLSHGLPQDTMGASPSPSSPPAYLSGSSARPGAHPSLPMRAPTRALSSWKQSGAAESRAWPAAARGGRCRAARLGPPEPSAPRGVHPSPPGLPVPFPRRPPPSTEARPHEGVLGDQHSDPAAAAARGQPDEASSSSLLASQSDMATPPNPAAHAEGLGASQARGALIGRGGSLSEL